MRSRLEASFAGHLDEAGIKWTYEPMCFGAAAGQYLPDFRLEIEYRPHCDEPRSAVYVEVKPTFETAAAVISSRVIDIIRQSDVWARLLVWRPGDAASRFMDVDSEHAVVPARCCDCGYLVLACECESCIAKVGHGPGRCISCGFGRFHADYLGFRVGGSA